MPTTELERLIVRFDADTARLDRGLNQVERRARRSSRTMQRSFDGIGRSITGATAALGRMNVALASIGVGAFGVGSIANSFLKFDNSLRRITGLVGVAEREVAGFRQELLEMGPAIGKGPVELAEALFFVTSAGLRGERALETLRSAALAAKAGLGETRDVAFALVSALNAYEAEGLDAATATDILVKTVEQGNLEAASLARSLGRVLPVAQAAGTTLNDVGAATAALTRIGFSTQQAIDSIRLILAALSRESAEGEKQLSRVGLTFQDIRDTIRREGLLEGLTLLRDAIGDSETALVDIFGEINAVNGVLGLTGERAETVRTIFESLRDPTGALADALDDVTDSAQDRLDKALANMEASMIRIGSVVLPPVAVVLGDVADEIDKMGRAASAIESLIKTLEERMGDVESQADDTRLSFEKLWDIITGREAFNMASEGFSGLIDDLNVMLGLTKELTEAQQEETRAFNRMLESIIGRENTRELNEIFNRLFGITAPRTSTEVITNLPPPLENVPQTPGEKPSRDSSSKQVDADLEKRRKEAIENLKRIAAAANLATEATRIFSDQQTKLSAALDRINSASELQQRLFDLELIPAGSKLTDVMGLMGGSAESASKLLENLTAEERKQAEALAKMTMRAVEARDALANLELENTRRGIGRILTLERDESQFSVEATRQFALDPITLNESMDQLNAAMTLHANLVEAELIPADTRFADVLTLLNGGIINTSDAFTELTQEEREQVQEMASLTNQAVKAAGELRRLGNAVSLIFQAESPIDKYNRRVKELTDLMPEIIRLTEDASKAQEIYNQQMLIIARGIDEVITAQEQWADIADGAASILSRGLEDAIFHAESLQEAIRNIGLELSELAFRVLVTEPLEQALRGVFRGNTGAHRNIFSTEGGLITDPNANQNFLERLFGGTSFGDMIGIGEFREEFPNARAGDLPDANIGELGDAAGSAAAAITGMSGSAQDATAVGLLKVATSAEAAAAALQSVAGTSTASGFGSSLLSGLNLAPLSTPLAEAAAFDVAMNPSIFHKGGIVGTSRVGSRVVPASLFKNAPRLHDGLAPDEFPAILQRGEEVIPRSQVNNSNTENVTIQVNVPGDMSRSRARGLGLAAGQGAAEAFMHASGASRRQS